MHPRHPRRRRPAGPGLDRHRQDGRVRAADPHRRSTSSCAHRRRWSSRPTRELAIQVAEAFQKYAAKMPGFHVLPIYGGQSYTPQLKGLKRGAHVIVGTPGRVARSREERRALQLDQLKFLVLDEGDEMLQMGFVDDIECLFQQAPRGKAGVRCSPRRCRTPSAASRRRTCAIRARSACSRAAKPRRRSASVTGWSAACTSSTPSRACSKPRSFDAMLVFVRTKLETVDLAQRLEARGFAASALNGDMEQRQREQMVAQLKNGKIDILIATDVAARGLDVDRISHVINYDIPYDSETYMHRIGRTGRAGRTRRRHPVRESARAEHAAHHRARDPAAHRRNEDAERRRRERIARGQVQGKDHRRGVVAAPARNSARCSSRSRSDGNIPAIEIAAALASMVQGSTPLFLAQKPESEQPKAPPRIDGSVPHADVSHRSRPRARRAAGQHRRRHRQRSRHRRQDTSATSTSAKTTATWICPACPMKCWRSLQDVRVRGEEIRIAARGFEARQAEVRRRVAPSGSHG